MQHQTVQTGKLGPIFERHLCTKLHGSILQTTTLLIKFITLLRKYDLNMVHVAVQYYHTCSVASSFSWKDAFLKIWVKLNYRTRDSALHSIQTYLTALP